MKKIRSKKIIIIAVLGVCLMVGEFLGVLPYLVARTVSSIYAAINYPERKLKFQSGEYAFGFGDYSVVYKDKDENIVNFMLTPKELPVIIRWDSIKMDSMKD
jgi:hypothetical protein